MELTAHAKASELLLEVGPGVHVCVGATLGATRTHTDKRGAKPHNRAPSGGGAGLDTTRFVRTFDGYVTLVLGNWLLLPQR